MVSKNRFKLKLYNIAHLYGRAASNYFKENPQCARCNEKRIACLSVHHVHGKSEDVFETLCANCHMLHHAVKTKDYTYDDFLQEDGEISEYKKQKLLRNAIVWGAYQGGKKQCEIAKEMNLSSGIVSHIVRKCIAENPNWQQQNQKEDPELRELIQRRFGL